MFASAGRLGGDSSVQLVSRGGSSVVEASHADRDRRRPRRLPDLVVVPGGGWDDRDRPGAWSEARDGGLPSAFGALSDVGVTIASVCSGGMLLSEAGLLEGRPPVTRASVLDDLRESGADVRDARVVDAGSILTAGGVTAGLDLAVHLVAPEMEFEPSDDVLVV